MPLHPGRKRPQPSQVANNGKCVKEEHEPRKGRLSSCRVATRSVVAVNRLFSPPPQKRGIIHQPLIVVDKASTIILASFINRASATGILRDPSRALPEKDREKGERPTCPHLHETLQGRRIQPAQDPLQIQYGHVELLL
ncbi:hypothetical protein TcCL_Unassigned02777 [Trypanosoma cruzi]|nr:hypothetical protein TcCL_Unassigned02777 [Trypanosoma cruzi]